jgi:ribosomal protein L34E
MDKKIYKCEICGKLLKTQQTLNIHKLTHGKDNKKQDDNENKENKSGECVHELIILNSNNPNQKKAIADGFSAYCKKCFTLI